LWGLCLFSWPKGEHDLDYDRLFKMPLVGLRFSPLHKCDSRLGYSIRCHAGPVVLWLAEQQVLNWNGGDADG
jgi:hypothetical protein